MTPTTRRAILNLALCAYRTNHATPDRCARYARAISQLYHRDHQLTEPQRHRLLDAHNILCQGAVTSAHSLTIHALNATARDLRLAASYPNEPTPAVVYGIT